MRPAAGSVVFQCCVSVYADDHICPAYAVERGVRYGAVRTNEDERQRLPELRDNIVPVCDVVRDKEHFIKDQ